jgi:hypothetical protein
VIALPLGPSLENASDDVWVPFRTEGSNGKSRIDSLASALAAVYRGNPPAPSPLSPGVYSVNLGAAPARVAEESEEAGLGRWPGALTLAQMLEQLEDVPQEVDLLAENLPCDTAGSEQAVEQYLDQVDGLGGILTDLLTSERLRPWLHGAALAAVGAVVAHRMRRKAKSDVHNGAGKRDEPESPWLFDLHSAET